MKADDPRLEAASKAAFERVEKYNALVLAVLKGHLAVEEAMDECLAAAVSNPQYIFDGERRFMFAAKANVCLSLCFGQHIDNVWSILWAVNALRNKVAHTKELDKINIAMANLRKVYFDMLTPEQAKGIEKQRDEDIVVQACATCAGFFAIIAEEAKSRRRVMDQHWKTS